MRSAQQARRGFTIMELLIVIGIIVALMGLLIPAAGMVKRLAQKAKVEALIQNVASATTSYRQLNGEFPIAYDLDDDGSIDPSSERITTTSDLADLNNHILVNCLASVDRELIAPGSKHLTGVDRSQPLPLQLVDALVIDFWSTPLRYRPYQAYPRNEGETLADGKPNPDATEAPPMPDDFQLWSAGPDGVDDLAVETTGDGDDIANWE